MGKLTGKVAFVTGASSGIGEAAARLFAAEGAKVVLAARRDKTQKVVDEIRAAGGEAIFTRLDVSKEDQWQDAVREAEATFGPVNILLNCAGIVIINPDIRNITVDEFMQVVNTNLVGCFLGIKTIIPSMINTENGAIVNISSIAGISAPGASMSYTATKFAIRGLTRHAARELAPYGIRVNSVHPGVIETEMNYATPKHIIDALAENIPLQRIGQPEEIAKLILFLATDATFSTGSEFIADGGHLI